MAGKMAMIKIAVLGEGGVGKTSLTIQVRRVSAPERDPFTRPSPLLIRITLLTTLLR